MNATPSPGPESQSPGWHTVVVQVPPEQVEIVSDLLWSHGPAAVEERTDDGGAILLAGFDQPGKAEHTAAELEASGFGPAEVRQVVDDGLDGWRPYARVERAWPFVLVPAWLEPSDLAPDETVILIDPGRTFGSGSHPTTRLCLVAMARVGVAGATVLDVGTGSGVLAVGAALLGASSVLGLDIDPSSPGVTAANAARNGVGHLVAASTDALADVARPPGGFDLVVANLLAPILKALADDLVGIVRPGGTLIVSGLLAHNWRPTVDRLTAAEITSVDEEDGWVAVTLRIAS